MADFEITEKHDPYFKTKNGKPPLLWAISGLVAIAALWMLAVWFVNPVGDFHVNDDWAFHRALERLLESGTIGSTGWGPSHAPGGPSLITHLMWGALFVKTMDYSHTTLRLSTICMGVIGSLGIYCIALTLRVSTSWSILCALTLAFNPLYFSQSFTYMSDVTFAAILVWSLFFLVLSIKKTWSWALVAGLILSLLSILTRQVGVVIPVALIIVSFFADKGMRHRPKNIIPMVLCFVILPWIGYEMFLSLSGATPITEHQVIHRILRYPMEKGPLNYFLFLLSSLFIVALPYTCFFVIPELIPRVHMISDKKVFKWLAISLILPSCLIGLMDIVGIIDIKPCFYRNIIYDFGIGPLLFKDTYILGMQRTWSIPGALYVLMVCAALLAMIAFVTIAIKWCGSVVNKFQGKKCMNRELIPGLALISGLLYVAIILLTGFHDRYLIPVCVFFILFLLSMDPVEPYKRVKPMIIAFSVAVIVLFGLFSVLGVRDFMEIKRAQAKAHSYILNELKADPCYVDGGFEFNGYHCYDKDHQPIGKTSWWWVKDEKYVVTLGPIDGYRTVKSFPFKRIMGRNSSVFILAPEI